MLEGKEWNTGSNNRIELSEIFNIISQYTSSGSKVYIGSDSFITRKKVCFASAICLYGPGLKSRYFFFREYENQKKYINLAARITEETRRSVEIAEVVMENLNLDPQMIELHLDVSPFSANNSTSRFSEMLKGYVNGYGLNCKLKPNAWAGQSIADKHSK